MLPPRFTRSGPFQPKLRAPVHNRFNARHGFCCFNRGLAPKPLILNWNAAPGCKCNCNREIKVEFCSAKITLQDVVSAERNTILINSRPLRAHSVLPGDTKPIAGIAIRFQAPSPVLLLGQHLIGSFEAVSGGHAADKIVEAKKGA